MFRINYKVIKDEWDDFDGQNGYIQLYVNDHTYGTIYSFDLDGIMSTDYLDFWFERICRAAFLLEKENLLFVSDTDSNNVWIECKKCENDLEISIIDNEKLSGQMDIEFLIDNSKVFSYGWGNQVVDYDDLMSNLLFVVGSYIDYLNAHNVDDSLYKTLLNNYNQLLGLKKWKSVFKRESFISKVMNKLLSGDDLVLKKLREQYESSTIKLIEWTSAGFFIDFDISEEEIVEEGVRTDFQFGDVYGNLDGMVGAVGFVIFIRNGKLSMLEGYTMGADSWPCNEDITLVYDSENRDLVELRKEWIMLSD